MPTGTLVITDASRQFLPFDLYGLLAPTSFYNIFRRDINRNSRGAPICRTCTITFPGQGDLRRVKKIESPCQPLLDSPEPYVSLHETKRKMAILRESTLILGRLRNFPVGNVYLPMTTQLRPRYTTKVAQKMEWDRAPELRKLVLNGKVKSILDAGAGSCSFASVLAQEHKWRELRQYMAFGAYDCKMLRVCAERGFISFQHNWLNRLPLCERCQFDLVVQFEGLHHVQGSVSNLQLTFDNFDRAVACGGYLHLDDRDHRWNRNPRPQPQAFDTLAFLI